MNDTPERTLIGAGKLLAAGVSDIRGLWQAQSSTGLWDMGRTPIEAMIDRADMRSCCEDCNRPYASGGFPDLIIPYDAWKQISTNGDDSGLLCPSCICQRLHDKGITCTGAFMSGPIESVESHTMNYLLKSAKAERSSRKGAGG